jgi:hypothetical protein
MPAGALPYPKGPMSPATARARREATWPSAPPPGPERRPARLKATDRCDQCGSRAYVAAEIHAVDLLFCAHHYRHHEDRIADVAEEILDERWQLDEHERIRKEYHNS